jgi:hypothetical protein
MGIFMGYSWDIMIIYDTTSQPGWMLVCGPENGGFSLIEHQFMAILMVKMNEHDDKPIGLGVPKVFYSVSTNYRHPFMVENP